MIYHLTILRRTSPLYKLELKSHSKAETYITSKFSYFTLNVKKHHKIWYNGELVYQAEMKPGVVVNKLIAEVPGLVIHVNEPVYSAVCARIECIDISAKFLLSSAYRTKCKDYTTVQLGSHCRVLILGKHCRVCVPAAVTFVEMNTKDHSYVSWEHRDGKRLTIRCTSPRFNPKIFNKLQKCGKFYFTLQNSKQTYNNLPSIVDSVYICVNVKNHSTTVPLPDVGNHVLIYMSIATPKDCLVTLTGSAQELDIRSGEQIIKYKVRNLKKVTISENHRRVEFNAIDHIPPGIEFVIKHNRCKHTRAQYRLIK